MMSPWKSIGRPLLLAFLLLGVFSATSFAWWYGPYGYPVAGYPARDPLPPRGAALGPWKGSFSFGGGPTTVTGGARREFQSGWNFNFTGGYNFTPRLGLLVEFGDSALGLTDRALQSHQAIDGDARVWSITLQPTWRFRIAGPVGGYLIGGGGFYERERRFTEPVDIFIPTSGGTVVTSGFADFNENEGNGGLNAGLGLTCNLGWGTKFFVEGRYHHVFGSGGGLDYIPVTIGLRW